MCIRDRHWSNQGTRRMFCNGVTLFPHYVTIWMLQKVALQKCYSFCLFHCSNKYSDMYSVRFSACNVVFLMHDLFVNVCTTVFRFSAVLHKLHGVTSTQFYDSRQILLSTKQVLCLLTRWSRHSMNTWSRQLKRPHAWIYGQQIGEKNFDKLTSVETLPITTRCV